MELTEKVLQNGMRLTVLASPESELATLAVVFHVGFAHETKEHLGISHMVEHLCFGDNEARTFPELRSAIERLGGSFNGHTAETHTAYHLDLLVDHWRQGVGLLRDIAFRPRFGPEACAREVKILLTETGQLRQRWLAWLYERGWFRSWWTLLDDQKWGEHMHSDRSFHRYGDLAPQDLAAWHGRHYRLDNMAVVAVGRLDPQEVEEEVEQCFAGLPTGSDERLHHPEPSAPTEATTVTTRVGRPFWNQSVVAVGSWTNGGRIGEGAVCDVVEQYLGHRAFDRLRIEHSLAYGAWCSISPLRNAGHFLLATDVKRGREQLAERLLKEILSEELEREIPDEELADVRNMLLARHARLNANPSRYAWQLIRGAFGEYPADIEDYADRLRGVTPSQVKEVLGRLSSERGSITVRQVPLLSVPQAVLIAGGVLAALAGLILWAVLG